MALDQLQGLLVNIFTSTAPMARACHRDLSWFLCKHVSNSLCHILGLQKNKTKNKTSGRQANTCLKNKKQATLMIRAKTAGWSCTELVNSVYSGWAIAPLISSRPNLAAIEKRPARCVCYCPTSVGSVSRMLEKAKQLLSHVQRTVVSRISKPVTPSSQGTVRRCMFQIGQHKSRMRLRRDLSVARGNKRVCFYLKNVILGWRASLEPF